MKKCHKIQKKTKNESENYEKCRCMKMQETPKTRNIFDTFSQQLEITPGPSGPGELLLIHG